MFRRGQMPLEMLLHPSVPRMFLRATDGCISPRRCMFQYSRGRCLQVPFSPLGMFPQGSIGAPRFMTVQDLLRKGVRAGRSYVVLFPALRSCSRYLICGVLSALHQTEFTTRDQREMMCKVRPQKTCARLIFSLSRFSLFDGDDDCGRYM